MVQDRSEPRRRNIRTALVDLLIARDADALAVAGDGHPQPEQFLRWREDTDRISARQLAAGAIALATELLLAGEVQIDERACAIEIAPAVVCGHRDSEHAGERCDGCLTDLGRDFPHRFVDDPAYRYADRDVLLGADRRFHLIEDCALEAAEDAGQVPPDGSTVYEALALGYERCPRCVGNWFEGFPRALRARLAEGLAEG